MPVIELRDLGRTRGPGAAGAPAEAARERFEDEDADTLSRRDGLWLVKGLWPRVGVVFVAGPSMSGKSFWIIDQASRVAKGQPVLGRRSLRSGAVYIAAEGANGVRARFEGLRSREGPWEGMIRFIADAPNLASPEDVSLLLGRLRAIADEMAAREHRLGLIVLDTLSASMPGGDENASGPMSLILKSLQDLATKLSACVLVIAHVGKDAEKGIRGWSGLLANADAAITIRSPNSDGTRIGEVTKTKDGESGDKFAFGLEVVGLGPDADGDPASTCIIQDRIVPADTRPAGRSGPGAASEMVLKALDRLLADGPTADVSHLPGVASATRGVRLAELRAKTFGLGFYEATKPSDDDDIRALGRWKEARKTGFRRATDKLVELRVVRHEGSYVWPV